MDHPGGGKIETRCDLGLSGLAATQGSAMGHEFRSRDAVNCTVDAAATQKGRIGSVDDRVGLFGGDVAENKLEPRGLRTCHEENSSLSWGSHIYAYMLSLGSDHTAKDQHGGDKQVDQLLPEWAQPFGDADAADEYWDLVCEIAHTRWGDDITLSYLWGRAEHSDGRVAQIHNIAKDAVGLDRRTQRNSLYNFFSMLDDMKREREQFRDWEWAAPRLRRRLQANWECPWELVDEPVDPYTNWVVALASESGCAPVAAAWLDDWKVDAAEVWERATAHSMRPKRLRRRKIHHVAALDGRPAALTFDKTLHCFDGDMYTTGLAIDLTDRLPGQLGEDGALVVAPTAHQLYVMPITDLAEVPPLVIPLMVMSVLRQHTEPNPVSRSVFWYREPGRLEPCMTYSPEGQISVCAEEPLAKILNDYEKQMAA